MSPCGVRLITKIFEPKRFKATFVSHPGGISSSKFNSTTPALEKTVSGTLPSPVWMFETDVQYTITGAKTWNGLAPYIGGGLGYAWRSSSTEGPDAYDFGGRFYWAPFAGTRLFINPNAFIRAEIRGAFWRLAYPPPYYEDITGILQSYAINNYLSNVWYQVGFGYSF